MHIEVYVFFVYMLFFFPVSRYNRDLTKLQEEEAAS